MNKRRIDEIGIKYVESLKLYEEYATRIRNLIQDLVELEGVEFYAIDGWAETPAELLRALSGLEEEELGGVDLVTVRVLLRFPEDVLRIEELVKAEFEIDDSRSVPSSGLEDPYRFGYPAVVYILSLSSSRAHLREWAKYQDLTFRLELRTMLQEAWATIFPKVNQTVGTVSEKKLTRELVLLAALLEKADQGFLSLRNEIKDEALLIPPKQQGLEQENKNTIEAEKLFTDEELYNLFRSDSLLLGRWNALTLEAGFPEFKPEADYLRESFAYLCKILRAANINTISDAKKFLAEMEEGDKGLRQLRAVHDSFDKNIKWRMDPFSALFLLVLNFKWEELKDKPETSSNGSLKKGSDRIRGLD
ncbi:MAG: RelA/SpoT domain-containing protein [Synergistaceae bacterium]|nr:RelA/SpoT domain-containing protein [Synergistaceae bacterium]